MGNNFGYTSIKESQPIAFSRYLTMDYFKSCVQNANCIAYLYFADIL